jgi:ADP-ribose pyrophosphatase
MIEPWKLIESKVLGDFRIFTLRADQKVSPRTGKVHDFFVIESVNWVNIVATTPDQHLVLVEQYRHGSNTVELEVPGGMMDAQDGSPEATALRELREETGYEGDRAQVIGRTYPNPAIMSNICHVVWVENCQLKHPVEWDHSEDLVTRLVPIAQIPDLVAGGSIRHSLVIVALYLFELWQRRPTGENAGLT